MLDFFVTTAPRMENAVEILPHARVVLLESLEVGNARALVEVLGLGQSFIAQLRGPDAHVEEKEDFRVAEAVRVLGHPPP